MFSSGWSEAGQVNYFPHRFCYLYMFPSKCMLIAESSYKHDTVCFWNEKFLFTLDVLLIILLLFVGCQGFTNSLVFTGHLLDIPGTGAKSTAKRCARTSRIFYSVSDP